MCHPVISEVRLPSSCQQPSWKRSSPEEGRNALLGAATAMLNIHALPWFSSADTRINVGILEGGTAANIIAEHARMVIEPRSTSEETN